MMPKFTVDIDLSTDEDEQFSCYLDEHCYDRDKWVRRLIYTGIRQAAGKWKQPVGKVSAVFKQQDTAKGKVKK
jgi:hypothetical protein